MGGAPVIEQIRPGVSFEPDAAASFRRVESEWRRRTGSLIDVNSSTRSWAAQQKMFVDWTRYVDSGYNPAYKPAHSRALPPDQSVHCQGRAVDSDDWTSPGFIQLMEEHGWIRTAAGDPTEQHHFEYQWWADQHYGEPEDDMFTDEDREDLQEVRSHMTALRAIVGGSVKNGKLSGKNIITLVREIRKDQGEDLTLDDIRDAFADFAQSGGANGLTLEQVTAAAVEGVREGFDGLTVTLNTEQ